MNVLLDTCVLLDYLQAREPFFDSALNIMIGAANNEYSVFMKASSMTDLFFIIRRHTHNIDDARRYLSQLAQIVGILDTTAEDCLNAMHSEIKDYEDAVMEETACRSGMDVIVTRNIRDYGASRVRTIDPREFSSLW